MADIPKQSSLSDPQKVISQLFPRSGFVRQGRKSCRWRFYIETGKTARLLSLILFSLHFHDCPAKGGEIRRLFAEKLLLVSHRHSIGVISLYFTEMELLNGIKVSEHKLESSQTRVFGFLVGFFCFTKCYS